MISLPLEILAGALLKINKEPIQLACKKIIQYDFGALQKIVNNRRINMFIILLTYKKPLPLIDQHLAAHADFLQKNYEQNHFIVSGRKVPRTGGVMVSQLNDIELLKNILKNDPFHIHDIADYEIIEFTPGKYHPNFSAFIEN